MLQRAGRLFQALKNRVLGDYMRDYLAILAMVIIACMVVLHPLIAISVLLLVIFAALILFVMVFIMLGAPPVDN